MCIRDRLKGSALDGFWKNDRIRIPFPAEAELMGVKNFGATSLGEVKIRLTEFGLSLRTLDAE